jgi:hypothetical protein
MPSLYVNVTLALFIIAAVITPFLLSLLLTTIQPELRIVPPFYITLISFAWLFVLWVNPSNVSATLTPVITLGTFYVTLGFAEDKLATLILGIAAERERIYFEYLTVYSDIDDVKARFAVPEIRRELFLSERIEGNAEQGYLFKTRRGLFFKNQILVTRSKEYPHSTDVKIVYYEEGKYNLKISPVFPEVTRKTSLYLKDVLYNREPKLGFEVAVEFTNTARDSLIDRVIDEMRGYYVRSKQFSYADKFKIAMLAGVLILTVVLFLIEQPVYGALTIAIEVLLAVLALPDIFGKQKV